MATRLVLLAVLLPGLAFAGTPARRDVPAVEHLAEAFASEVQASREGARGGTLALAFTASSGEGDQAAGGELGRLVERMLTGQLRDRGGYDRVIPVPAGDPEAAREAARAAGARDLVQADLHRIGGELLLSGSLESTWVNFWTGEAGGPVRALSTRVRADRAALLLARAAPGAQPAGGSLSLRPLVQLSGRIVAAAIGDADEDGRAELFVLTDDALLALRLEGGALRTLASRSLAGRPRALVAARDTAGGLVVAPIALRMAVAYHHSDLAEGEVLAFDGAAFRRVAGLPEVPLAAAGGLVLYGGLVPGTSTFQGLLRLAGTRGDGAAPVSRSVDAGAPIVAAALTPDGSEVAVVDARWQLRWLGDGAAKKSEKKRGMKSGPQPVGAGLALADVDGDGVLERVGSAAVPPGAEDRLIIAAARGEVRELRPVPGAVRALAAGDATGDGRDDVVVGATDGRGSFLYLLTEDRL